MGIAKRNMEMETTDAVVGDGATKDVPHNFGTIPSLVLFTPEAAGTDAFLVSVDSAKAVVQGAAGTFKVHIIK